MIDALKLALEESHTLGEIDRAFADMVVRRSDVDAECADELFVLAALALNAVRGSHSCLDVAAWCEAFAQEKSPEVRDDLAMWRGRVDALSCSAVGELSAAGGLAANAVQPLMRWHSPDGRLLVYLNRFCVYEQVIADKIRRRLAILGGGEGVVSPEEIHNASGNFAKTPFEEDFQQQAVYHALRSGFSIITGGPGTGKTTVLSVILALLFKHTDRPLSIALCAPTGKAAARMRESVEAAVEGALDDAFDDSVKAALLSLKPTTVHRLIGVNADTDYPRVNQSHPLDCDVIAVDECSMMSLQLFSQLLCAVRPTAKIILLGDENQLASVDAGNVLSELCHCGMLSGEASGIRVVNRLKVNHRSYKNPRLCAYSAMLVDDDATAAGRAAGIRTLYGDESAGDSGRFRGIETALGTAEREKQLKAVLGEFLDAAGIGQKPASYGQAAVFLKKVKILCAVREGVYGVMALNRMVRECLKLKDDYADGVPVMILKNDAVTGLNNGDVGICFKGKVYFGEDDAELSSARAFEIAQLPPHEVAFAMTIHKSQGSDYENVLMVLPDKDNPVLCRELVYTGITRTKVNFTLLAPQELLAAVQIRRTERWTGLGMRMTP